MYLYIEFTNGSNAWLKYGIPDRKAMENDVRRWRKHFKLERIKTTKDGDRFYRATEKATEGSLF